MSEDIAPIGGVGTPKSVEALAGRKIPQPVLATVWTREDAQARKHARLSVYLGAAPGVGKTYAMLGEGQRAKARGTDVVVGVAQTYGRPRTIEMLNGLEVIPPRILTYQGLTFEEMDVEALIKHHPERALIDELAEGIAVITTVNVQHLASLNDLVARITGIRQQETVPDWVLDLADQVELVDMPPYALQRRMVHGNVYTNPGKAELVLMRVANQFDEEVLRRWSKQGIPETRERILVCVSRPGVSEDLIRRGCRIAHRTQGDLLVIHVATSQGDPDSKWLGQVRRLVQDLGGEFQVLEAEDPVNEVLSFAYQQHVTQILVGESLRSRWQELLRGSFVNRLIQKASNIDVHVIARKER